MNEQNRKTITLSIPTWKKISKLRIEHNGITFTQLIDKLIDNQKENGIPNQPTN